MTQTQSFAPALPGQPQPSNQSLVEALAAQYGGPAAIPVIQHSRYLDAFLQQMQGVGPTLRSASALGTNLLAEALAQYGRHKTDQQLAQVANDGRTALLNSSALPGEITVPAQPAPQDGGGLLSRLSQLFHGGGQAQSAPVQSQGAPSDASGTPATPAAQALPAPAQGTGLDAASGQTAGGATAGPLAVGLGQTHQPLFSQLGSYETGNAALADAVASQVRGIRNNNPVNVTNLAHGKWNGQVGSDGQYAVFDNPADGWAAADKNLANYGRLHGIDTIGGVVNRWAPAAAGNNPSAYGGTVAGGMGMGVGDHIDLSNPSLRHMMLGRMAGVETGAALQYGQDWRAPQPQSSQSNPPSAAASTASAQQSAPAPRPVQISTGPDPSVPLPGSQGPSIASPYQALRPGSQPAQSAVQGQAGQAPGTGLAQQPQQGAPPPPSPQILGGGFSPQPVPPQQWQVDRLNALKQQAIADPRFVPQFMAYKSELLHQLSTPEELQFTRPNDAGQVQVYGKSTGRLYGVQAPGGMIIQAGPKMVSNGQGGFAPVPGTGDEVLTPAQSNALGYHGNSVVTRNQATGQTSVSQGPDFAPSDYLSQRAGFIGGDTYQTASKTVRAVNAVQKILSGATGNNGAVDTGALDNLVQAETGLSAKVGTMKLFLENYDLPATVQNQILHLTGPGSITPDHLAQALNVLRSYGAAHTQAAQRELEGLNGAVAGASGGRYRDLSIKIPQMDPMPNVPWMGAANPASPGSPANPPGQAPGGGQAPSAPAAPAQPSPGQRLSPQQAAALPPGTRFIGMDGVARVRR